MAGNARFHDKLHRKNHHTNPTVGFPDSASDPIASPDQPFQGDFVVNGVLSSNQGISLLSANIDGDVYCENIHVNDFTYTDYISGNSTEVIISDGSLIGNGNNTLTLDFGNGIYNRVNNKTAMYINSLGKVGIGTTSPTETLHVDGNVLITGNLSSLGDTTQIDTNIVTTSAIVIDTYGTTNALRVTQRGSGNAILVEDDTNPDSTPFVVTSAGYVGIGTSTPTRALVIEGDSGVASDLIIRSVENVSNTNDGPIIAFQNKPLSGYAINGNNCGYIGARGFTTVAAKSGSDGYFQFAGIGFKSTGNFNTLSSTQGCIIFNTVSGGGLNYERMRINHDGNVGIGDTTPDSKLSVYSSSSNTQPAVTITQSGTAAALIIQDQLNDPNPFMIDGNGNVSVGSLSTMADFGGNMRFNVAGTGTQRMGLWSYANNNSSAGVFSFNKSFNNTFGLTGAPTIDNSNVGLIDFSYYSQDGILRRCASIQGEVEGNNAVSGSSPGKLVFMTATSGSYDASTKMVIDHMGKVGIATGEASLSANPQKLQVASDALINYITVGRGNLNSTYNTAVGYHALCSASASFNIYNVAVGDHTLSNINGSYDELSGRWNTAVGSYALYNSTIGNGNVAIGTSSQRESISGYNNVAVGVNSLYANISGYQNVSVGNNTLRFDQGHSNTAIGYFAMSQSLSTSNNVAIGKYALYWNLSGNNNVAIGRSALVSAFSSENVAIGYSSGNTIQYGYENVLLGSRTDTSTSDGINQIVIGYSAQGIANNTAVIGNASISATKLRGNVQGLKSSIEKDVADTLTISELMNEYIVTKGTTYTLTLATANNLDNDTFWKIQIGSVIKFTILNSATGTITLSGYGGSTGITLKFGTTTVSSSASKNFILRKTDTNEFDLYADV